MAQELQGSVNQLTDRPLNPFGQGRKSASWFSRRLRLPARQRRKNSNHAWVPPTGTGLNPVTGLLQAIVDIHKEGGVGHCSSLSIKFRPPNVFGLFHVFNTTQQTLAVCELFRISPTTFGETMGDIRENRFEFHLHFDPQVLGIATMWGPGKDNRYLGG